MTPYDKDLLNAWDYVVDPNNMVKFNPQCSSCGVEIVFLRILPRSLYLPNPHMQQIMATIAEGRCI